MSNDYRAYVECDYNSIYHHGIKGMKWGVRRYQNEDGSLTPEGRRKYGKLFDKYKKRGYSDGEALAMAKNKKSNSNRLPSSYESKLKSRYDKVKKENPKWIKDNFGNDSFKSIMNNDPDLLDMALDEYDLEKKSKRRSR